MQTYRQTDRQYIFTPHTLPITVYNDEAASQEERSCCENQHCLMFIMPLIRTAFSLVTFLDFLDFSFFRILAELLRG